MSTFRRKALGAVLFFLASVASAATIQFNFAGVVTDDAINGCGGVVACGAVSGSYVFDSAALDGNSAADTGLYAATSITFAIDGTPFFTAASGVINVANFGVVDQYGLLALGGSAGNGSTADLSMLLQDFTHTAFSSDALPLSPATLAALLPGSFTLDATDSSFQLLGSITAITCSRGCDPVAVVPEPAIVFLFGVGLAIMGLPLRRRIWRRCSRAKG